LRLTPPLQGTRRQRVSEALVEMGSSVFTGITLTKLVGVSVLAAAPSHLFRLYYFRMYLGAWATTLALRSCARD
jgi:Niemann-Pick C1 protein